MTYQEAFTTAEIPTQQAIIRHENATAKRIAMIAAIHYRNEHEG